MALIANVNRSARGKTYKPDDFDPFKERVEIRSNMSALVGIVKEAKNG